MTTNQTTAAAAVAVTKKPLAEMLTGDKQRSVFAGLETAMAFLTRLATESSDFESYPRVFVGFDAEASEFDSAVYDGKRVMVSTLSKQIPAATPSEKAKNVLAAIVVTPVPTMDDILETDAGKAWADAILLKELNHVAVRPLRNAKDGYTPAVIAEIPTTVEGFISSQRAGVSQLAGYKQHWKTIRDALGKQYPGFARAGLSQVEMRRCLESRAFALANYGPLEDRESGSLFVAAIQLLAALCNRTGYDAAVLDTWATTRDQVEFTTADLEADDDDSAVDVDSLLATLLTPTDAPADEAPADSPTA